MGFVGFTGLEEGEVGNPRQRENGEYVSRRGPEFVLGIYIFLGGKLVMLSNKWTFSLKILVMMLAVALVASSAMAQDFDTTLSVSAVSFADGNQVEGGSVEVTVKFGKVVSIDDISGKISLLVYNKFGGIIGTETNTNGVGGIVAVAHENSVRPNVPLDGKTYSLSFSVAAGTNDNDAPSRATLRVGEGIVAAAPDDDERSQTADIEIYFVGPNPTPSDPMPVSIELANNLLVPADGFTGGSFDIIVTLSEKPKEGQFTKDHLDVDKGSASDSIYLGPVDPPQGQTATGRSFRYHRFLFTITPTVEAGDLVIKIKSFEDQEELTPNKYNPPTSDFDRTPGMDILTVKIKRATAAALIDETEEGGNRTASAGADRPITAAEAAATETAAVTAAAEKSEAEAAAVDAADKAKADAAAVVAKAADTSVRIPEVGEIYISEIMFAGGGTLPQWIEISNGSRTEQVNLSGWTLAVENAKADADVSVGSKVVFTVPEGTRIDPSGQHDTPSTVLVVTETGRNSLDGRMADSQVVNLLSDQQVELLLLGVTKRRYSLLSDIAFKVTLAPPAVLITPAADATDVVGNLSAAGTAAWALPMAEGNARSSIIRRHVTASIGPAAPKDGEMMDSWVLASDTGFAQSTHLSVHSYYGLPTDVSTPGFRAGGALPVELSYFRPERQKDSGAVVITWSTQSELNNAGFFLKRSPRRDGQFKIINAAMIPGAGTTSERQFYTYTDTTAQPNVVYNYQIEDVSLDGNRQTLTRGIRLKGHVGTSGKATVLWGELKTQE